MKKSRNSIDINYIDISLYHIIMEVFNNLYFSTYLDFTYKYVQDVRSEKSLDSLQESSIYEFSIQNA